MSKLSKHDEHLIRLADKLEGKGPYADVGPVPTHKFDLRDWYIERRGSQDSITRKKFNPHQCKTAACACGWASVDPWFNQHGLARLTGEKVVRFFGLSRGDEKYFNLFGDEFHFLFVNSAYRSHNPKPRTVARRIRKFVSTRQPS